MASSGVEAVDSREEAALPLPSLLTFPISSIPQPFLPIYLPPAPPPNPLLFFSLSFPPSLLFLPFPLLLFLTSCFTSIFCPVGSSQILATAPSSHSPAHVITPSLASYPGGSTYLAFLPKACEEASWVSSRPTPSVLQKHPTIYPSNHFTLCNG